MMKIRFLSACLLALVLVLSCTEEVSLETDAGTQVVITLKESAHATVLQESSYASGFQESGQVKSMLPEELLDQIRLRVERGQQPNAGAGDGLQVQGGPLSEDKLVAQLPTSMQARYQGLNSWAKRGARAAVNSK